MSMDTRSVGASLRAHPVFGTAPTNKNGASLRGHPVFATARTNKNGAPTEGRPYRTSFCRLLVLDNFVELACKVRIELLKSFVLLKGCVAVVNGQIGETQVEMALRQAWFQS